MAANPTAEIHDLLQETRVFEPSPEFKAQAVRIEVSDNGSGEGSEFAASPSTGVGLANIRDRLTQAYGASHRFETKKNDRGGFSVIVEIPFESGDTT